MIQHPNVTLGANATLGEYLVLGAPPRGKMAGELETLIGANAVIRSHTVIYAGNRIGDDFQTGHGVLVRENNRIGNGVSVGSHSIVEFEVEIGDGVMIHSNAFVPEYCVLEERCWIGPGVTLTNARYPRSRNVKETLTGVRVGRGAKVGAGVVVLPGITIGEGALIGAGAVVVKDVAPRAVVAGAPARLLRTLDEIPEYR
jgi:acetyltransferase-like isoleucine patch superfamily enzyme